MSASLTLRPTFPEPELFQESPDAGQPGDAQAQQESRCRCIRSTNRRGIIERCPGTGCCQPQHRRRESQVKNELFHILLSLNGF